MSDPTSTAPVPGTPPPPGTVRRAVIDIGTNSVKVLVGDVAHGTVVPVWETSEQTRLGRGFYDDHRLQPGPMADTARAVASFAAAASRLGTTHPRVLATSAVRDAANADDLRRAVRAAAGLDIEVVGGEQEAEWGFLGVATNPDLHDRHLLVLDVGGGSTEFILGRQAPGFRHSAQMGSVRLLEEMPPSDPPTDADRRRVRDWLDRFLDREILPRIGPVLDRDGRPDLAVGIGGTTAILALIRLRRDDFDREGIESTRFSRDDLTAMTHRLWSLPLDARRALPGMPPERADVILFGAAIYEAILRRLDLPTLGISTRGLRFAALLDGSGPGTT